jgi:class 3 adenylate cyclase
MQDTWDIQLSDSVHNAISAISSSHSDGAGEPLHSAKVGQKRVLFTFVPELDLQGNESGPEVKGRQNYCGLVFLDFEGRPRSGRRPGGLVVSDTDARIRLVRALRMIFSVVARRERRFSPFPAEISGRYWRDAATIHDTKPSGVAGNAVLTPPWDSPDTSFRTVTLALDLRKSTFCMSHVDDPARFANWLDELVGLMTAICHFHGGVFDKFTGDGCLVHFLEREYREVFATGGTVGEASGFQKQSMGTAASNGSAIHAALDAAVDMQRTMEVHLQRLRQNLRMDSDLLGAGVAIGVSDAFWSYDHHDNPIVVGPGVVDACRLCDRAGSGEVFLANNAYHALPQPVRDRIAFTRIPVTTKELDKEIQVYSWRLDRKETACVDLGGPVARLQEVRNGIYERSVLRKKGS